MSAAVPVRLRWAVDRLELAPEHRLLEIGGGRGVLAGLAADRLPHGSVRGIDRSATAVAATLARHAELVAQGRLAMDHLALEDADFPAASFDRVLAVNVNLFWLRKATDELRRIARWLRPGGSLHLVYEPPPSRVTEVTGRASGHLRAAGWTVETVTAEAEGSVLLDVTGRPAHPPPGPPRLPRRARGG